MSLEESEVDDPAKTMSVPDSVSVCLCMCVCERVCACGWVGVHTCCPNCKTKLRTEGIIRKIITSKTKTEKITEEITNKAFFQKKLFRP